MRELIKNVEQWADERGIFEKSDQFKQLAKTEEELYELADELVIDRDTDNIDNVKLELGDVVVTLILLAKMKGVDIIECLELAYDKISKRTGKMFDGLFVKDN